MASMEQVLKQLRAARGEALRELQKLDAAIGALEGARDGSRSTSRSRPRLSGAARRKISLAQKARWAKFRAQRKADKKAA